MLQTLESRFGFQMARIFGSEADAAQHVPQALWPFYLHLPEGQQYVPPPGHCGDVAAVAHVNHGVWRADCPFCPSGQHVSLADRRFFCARCLNEAVGNRTVPVAFPDDGTVDAIERLLLARPFVTSRNWLPGEAIGQLLAENVDHGV